MIIVLNPNADSNQLNGLKKWLTNLNLELQIFDGTQNTLIGLAGDTSVVDIDLLKALSIVKSVKRIQEPYKKSNRRFRHEDTIVKVGGVSIGGGNFAIMAGPCSVESEEQICSIADSVKSAGANILRGGAFKPRTSPYAFQGLRADGIALLLEAKKKTGLPIVSEIMDLSQLDVFADVDIIQVGARNMQNFELLKHLGQTDKPILLKRGLSATIQELLMSAEYIMAGGNNNIILCERGIRTFETATRNTLDLSAIPVLKAETHLPIVVDPSHATGIAKLVRPMSLAAVAAGADGLIIEVHNDPENALCDGAQSLTPRAFEKLSAQITALHSAMKNIEEMETDD